MGVVFGHLNLSDSERVFQATAGQTVVWDAVQQYLSRSNADLEAALSMFLGETTSDYKRRYTLPTGGTLQRRGSNGRYAAVKREGKWDIALPLEDFGAAIASNDVDRAYMTVRDLENHVLTVVQQNVNTVRYEILRALLNNAQDTFVDERWGNLLIEPLANGDSVVYPPAIGSETEATDNHYLESGYLAAAISDTNNPFPVIREELEEHFGVTAAGGNIAVTFNQAQTEKVRDLTDFVPESDPYIAKGVNADLPRALTQNHVGVVIGRVNGVWAIEWRAMPENYMLGIDLDAPQPLMRRIDPEDTGLPLGLNLVGQDEVFPFVDSFWRNRFGFGVGNRLNGVVMELGNGGGYTVPTGY